MRNDLEGMMLHARLTLALATCLLVIHIVVFDPARIIDRATYTKPDLPSDGVQAVLVNGVPVLRNGALIEGRLPGRAIRAPRGG